MNDQSPWRIPKKVAGNKLAVYHSKLEPLFKQALQELADSESAAYGVKISTGTVITNLSTRNGLYFQSKRSQLLKKYTQLKKEHEDNERNQAWEKSGGKAL